MALKSAKKNMWLGEFRRTSGEFPSGADYRTSHRGDRIAADYAKQFSDETDVKFLYWQLEQEILNSTLARLPTGQLHYLDFGCGAGRIGSFLEDRFATSTGVDVSPEMLSRAAAVCRSTRLVCADVSTEPDALTGRFDVITAFRFFLNAQPELRTKTLRWMRQHLDDAGMLICNFHLNPVSLVGIRKFFCHHLLAWEVTPMMSIRDAHRLLSDHGFAIQQTVPYGVLYYGRHRLWAPVKYLLPCERTLAHRWSPFKWLARNFVVIARPHHETRAS